MAEVHEITRIALDGLMARGIIYDECWGHGDYLVMSYLAKFGRTSSTVFLSERWESESQACFSANKGNYIGLMNAGMRGKFCNVYEVWHVVDDADDLAETLESLRQLREAGALDDVEPLHDDLSSHVTEGGKPKNWHLLIKFDGDDNEYRLTSADDARDFIATIESIYQLEQSSDADNDGWEDDLDELLMSGEGSNWRIKCPSVDKLEF